jgi:hypothetical protein
MSDEFKKLAHAASKSRDSIWELTHDYTPTLYSSSDPTDSIMPSPLYEVGIKDVFISTTEDVFYAWTGQRRLNGQTFHGPIYNLGTSTHYDGPRHCGCSICESHTLPSNKKN